MQASFAFDVSFGDGDPAGLSFDPNTFRWMDAAFHHLLRRSGGHAAIYERLGALGLGLVEASAQFRHPMRDGDQLALTVEVSAWSDRTLSLSCAGEVGGTPTFVGTEVRRLFMWRENSIVAGDIWLLRKLLEAHDDR